ncbi:MAG: phosphoglycerate kinase, partial [Planctomycetes bacterium]|nr:phosphoglycerate kinase [Planctomycetota bacterium]
MISADAVIKWCEELLFGEPNFPPLEHCLLSIPTLESLAHLPPGTRVLLRGDLDVVVDDEGNVEDDTRLRSLLETIRFGRQQRWVQLIYGHRGRNAGVSLAPIVPHLERLIANAGESETPISFIENWFNNESGEILDAAAQRIADLPEGAIVVLENTRFREDEKEKPLERILAKAKPSDLPALADRLTNYVNGVREKLARVHVNDAIAASNLDLSSTLVPMAMDHIALGIDNRRELEKYVTQTVAAELAVLSGMKLDKLDALQQMIERGVVKMVIVAGLLAVALKKADDPDFAMGNHEIPQA